LCSGSCREKESRVGTGRAFFNGLREQNIKENCLLKLIELVKFKGSFLIAIGYGVS